MKSAIKAVSVKELQEGMKLPQEIIVRKPGEEKRNGIEDFKCVVSADSFSERYASLQINGEYSGKATRYTLMMFLVYNGNGDLIDANFKYKISKDFDGIMPFSLGIQVPRDEYISKIAVRFVRDPAFL